MYDLIIIGAGPAGLTSALYALRANKKVLIIEKESIGGQMASSPLIENYPGFDSISGAELSNNMFNQLSNFDFDIEIEEVIKIIPGKVKKVITTDNSYETKSIIIATGSKYRLLGIDNEENLIGKGIHFCVACDGAFYKDKVVSVIGGGNSAVINAITLSDICKKVYVIQNIDKLTAEEILIDKLNTKDNVEIILNSKVLKIIGEEELQQIDIENNEIKNIKLDGMFISIGLNPATDIFKDILKLNNYGYIESNNCTTELEGVFVAGDCRDKKVRQITVATSDGTIASQEALKYLEG